TAPVRGPLSLPEIAQMAQQNISDAVIIGQIRSTRSLYNLAPPDIQWLKSQGVSDAGGMEMQATATRVAVGPARAYARPYGPPPCVARAVAAAQPPQAESAVSRHAPPPGQAAPPAPERHGPPVRDANGEVRPQDARPRR